MNTELAALEKLITEILRDHCSPPQLAAVQGTVDRQLWSVLDAAGLTSLGVAEDSGGSGGGWPENGVLLRLCGQYGAPVPIVEASVLAGWLLAASDLPRPPGILIFGSGDLVATPDSGGWLVTGSLPRTAYAREADELVAIAASPEGPVTVLLPCAKLSIEAGSNLAGEPRDHVLVELRVSRDRLQPAPPDAEHALRLRGALGRALQLAGAIESALDLTLTYTAERHQFGRPIAAFQAVQQQVACLAGEAAAVRAAVDGALSVFDSGRDDLTRFTVASAKVRASQGAGVAAAIAHQLHGAMGMTYEHRLRLTTMRLWSWRDEWGDEQLWTGQVSASVEESRDLWSLLVGTS